MDFEGIILSEISQAEKDKYHTISITCRTFFFKQQRKKPTHRKRDQVCGYHIWGQEEKWDGSQKIEGSKKKKVMERSEQTCIVLFLGPLP